MRTKVTLTDEQFEKLLFIFWMACCAGDEVDQEMVIGFIGDVGGDELLHIFADRCKKFKKAAELVDSVMPDQTYMCN